MIETIYNDFTTKLLPKLAEGFSITKDYFLDLFGRYVKYLIVIDTTWLVISVICILALIIGAVKLVKLEKKNTDDSISGMYIFFGIGLLIISVFILFFGTFSWVENLAKDIYIPEVRVYEELKGFMDNK